MIKIRLDVLISLLNQNGLSKGVYISSSLIKASCLNINDGERSGGENCLYDLNEGEIGAISDKWKVLVYEFVNKGPVFQKFCEDMSDFCEIIPPEWWFDSPDPKWEKVFHEGMH